MLRRFFESLQVLPWTSKNKSTSLIFEKLQVFPWNLKFFLKSTRPSLPLKKAPPLFPSPFPLRGQGMCQPPYSVLKPLRYMVGGPSEVYASSRAAVFCAGMNPPSLKDLLRGCLLVAFFENLQVLPWTLRDLRKPTSPPLPLREGPPLISVFSPQGRRGNRSSQ